MAETRPLATAVQTERLEGSVTLDGVGRFHVEIDWGRDGGGMKFEVDCPNGDRVEFTQVTIEEDAPRRETGQDMEFLLEAAAREAQSKCEGDDAT